MSKKYTNIFYSIIAMLLAILSIIISIVAINKDNYSNPILITKKNVEYPNVEDLTIYQNGFIFSAYDANYPGEFTTRAYIEIYFYQNSTNGNQSYLEIYLEIYENVSFETETETLEADEYNFTYTFPNNFNIRDTNYFTIYFESILINEFQYNISSFLEYSYTYENEEIYNDHDFITIERYVQDYAELYNQGASFLNIDIDLSKYYAEFNYNNGFSNGLLEGYEEGKNIGYEEGYEEGYESGVRDTINEGERFSLEWLQPIFKIVTDFLNVELIPGFKLIYFVTIPLFFSLIYMILKLFR